MFKVEREITKEDILNQVSEVELFKYYIKGFHRLNIKFSSELREDGTPSCIISLYKGKYMYKDFGDGFSGDVFNYIQRKFNCNFYESLRIISNDFKLQEFSDNNLGFYGVHVYAQKDLREFIDTPVIINTKVREWNLKDKLYWENKYFVTKDILDGYKVFPLESYTIYKKNQERFDFKCTQLTYGYWYQNTNNWAIYSPFNKQYKHVKNTTSEEYFGYTQLPRRGERVIITSSNKDVCAYKALGYWSVAPGSESCMFKNEILLDIRERFKEVYINLDSDKVGREWTTKNIDIFPFLKDINLPFKKDLSDLIEFKRKQETLKILKELL